MKVILDSGRALGRTLGRYRNAVLLLTALALGGLAAYSARGYIAQEIAFERERLQPKHDTVPVVVARSALSRGDVAGPDTMAVREVPREYVPASAITPDRFESYAGARLAAPMRAGEVLLQASLEGVDVSTFSAKVQPGIRALTVAVDEINSISGMLQPGDRIDLLLSARLPFMTGGAQPQEITRALMQDLRVLATGRQVRPGGDDKQGRTYTAITVEVSPEQAQRLVVAQRSGKLTAMLRNPGDHVPVAQAPMDILALLGLSQSAARGDASTRAPELIVGGHGPLKVVAGLAQLAPPHGGAPAVGWTGAASPLGMASPGVPSPGGQPAVGGTANPSAEPANVPPVSTRLLPAPMVDSSTGWPTGATGSPSASPSSYPSPNPPANPSANSSPSPLSGPMPLPADSTSDSPSARTITIR